MKILYYIKLAITDPKKFIFKVRNFLNYYFKLYIIKDIHLIEAKRWFRDRGDERLTFNYKLNRNSIVFDVGGYKGEFCEKIFSKFKCNVYVFEPHPVFFEALKKKFNSNKKIKVFNYGLSDSNNEIIFYDQENGSSFYKIGNKTLLCRVKKFSSVFEENRIKKIDLIKINIEGGEYSLMNNIIETNLIDKINHFQIQFHDFINDAVQKRASIISLLMKTHELKWCYEFVWESWSKKSINKTK